MLPFGIGLGEVLLILVVILLVVGPQKLPEMAKTVGKGLRTVRKASRDLRDAVDLDGVKQQVYQPIRQWEQQQRIEEAQLMAEEAKKVEPPSTQNAEPLFDPAIAEKPVSKPEPPPALADAQPEGAPIEHPPKEGGLLDEDAEQIIARGPSTLYKKPRLRTPNLDAPAKLPAPLTPTNGQPGAEDDGPDQPS